MVAKIIYGRRFVPTSLQTISLLKTAVSEKAEEQPVPALLSHHSELLGCLRLIKSSAHSERLLRTMGDGDLESGRSLIDAAEKLLLRMTGGR